MKRTLTLAAALLVVSAALIFQAACGGSSPAMPSPPGGGGGGNASVTITINGILGSNSFSPNPATVGSGQTVAWRNSDSTTHHIVADNGSFDSGLTPSGAMSAIVMPGTGAVPYHCTIHPSMVGSINGSTSGGPGGPGY